MTKDYSGKFEVLFPVEVFPNKLHPNEVDKVCGSLPEPPQPIGAKFQTEVYACKDEAVRLAHEGRFSELAAIPDAHRARLQAVVSPGDQQPQHQNENSFIQLYTAAVGALAQTLFSALGLRHLGSPRCSRTIDCDEPAFSGGTLHLALGQMVQQNAIST